MRALTAAIAIAMTIPSAYAGNDDASISKIFFGGGCNGVKKTEITKSESAAIGAALATAVVKEGVSYVADWFKDFKDTYKGSDTTTAVDYFYCTDAQKTIIGIRESLVYERRRDNASGDIQIRLESTMQMLLGDKNTPGFFVITPKSLKYKESISKRGKQKDITVVYSFTFFDKKGAEKTVTAEPILFKSIDVGGEDAMLSEKYGAKLIIPLPELMEVRVPAGNGNSVSKTTPFKLTIQFSEVSPGEGEELVGNITKAIGETISSEQDAIVTLLVSKLLSDELKEEEEASEAKASAAKPKAGSEGKIVQ